MNEVNVKISLDDFIKSAKMSDSVLEELGDELPTLFEDASQLVDNYIYYEVKPIAQREANSIKIGDLIYYGKIGDTFCDCDDAIVAVVSLGKRLPDKIATFFNSGDFFKGLLYDSFTNYYMGALVSTALTSFATEFAPLKTKDFVEIGSNVFEIDQLKTVFSDIKQNTVKLTDSMLMMPVKTCAFFVGLTKVGKSTCLTHDCSKCKSRYCPYRQDKRVPLRIENANGVDLIEVPIGSKLKDVFAQQNIDFSFPCNGVKNCGNCKIQILNPLPPTNKELQLIDGKLLAEGFRLACDYVINVATTIVISKQNSNILTNINVNLTSEDGLLSTKVCDNIKTVFVDNQAVSSLPPDKNAFGIAIDMGSTTIALYLVDMEKKSVVDVFSCINPQQNYGADVISRVLYASTNQDGNKILHNITVDAINLSIQKIATKNNLLAQQIIVIYLCGNTIMEHIVTGCDINSFGAFPFTPTFTKEKKLTTQSIGLNWGKFFYSAPNISSFVGGDITCGIVHCKKFCNEKSLLVDLGTNGEIALFDGDTVLVCSTAAGPALEGGEISCGMGATLGAIYDIILSKGNIDFKHWGDKPIGLCGSAIIKLIEQMLANDILDESGTFNYDNTTWLSRFVGDKFYITDTIYFSQKDIRKVQLAKASIEAGIKTTIKYANLTDKDIKNCYIGGGFGNYIEPSCLYSLGVLSKELLTKTTQMGNTAANGAILLLTSNAERDNAAKLSLAARTIRLDNSEDFFSFYTSSMIFEQE